MPLTLSQRASLAMEQRRASAGALPGTGNLASRRRGQLAREAAEQGVMVELSVQGATPTERHEAEALLAVLRADSARLELQLHGPAQPRPEPGMVQRDGPRGRHSCSSLA